MSKYFKKTSALVVGTLLFLGFLSFLVVVSEMRKKLENVALLKTQYPVVIYQGAKKPFLIEFSKNRPAQWVNFSAISPIAVHAIRLSEDWSFFQHNGFDFHEIKAAFEKNLDKGKFARGASTITQQVAKNVFLSQEKTIQRKLSEIAVALELEKNYKKNKILEVYLNIVEFGEGLFGIGPASRFYFGKSASELNAREGAFLAMLLPSPKKYSSSYRRGQVSPFAQKIMENILGKLKAANYLSFEEYIAARNHVFAFEKNISAPSLDDPDSDSLESEE